MGILFSIDTQKSMDYNSSTPGNSRYRKMGRKKPKKRRWLKMTFIILGFIILIDIILLLLSTGFLSTFGKNPGEEYAMGYKDSPHFNGKTFDNPVPTIVMPKGSMWKIAWRWFTEKGEREPKVTPPVISRQQSDFNDPPETDIRFTWLGHSTVLLECEGKRILTDPVWSKRCSPSLLYGPKRFHPVPIDLEDLPDLDAVIISHDHYDHLDKKVVQILGKRGTLFVTALGVGSHLHHWGIPRDQIIELDWWESHALPDTQLEIIATPARHFSGRGLKRDRTFWASWVIKGEQNKIFFCGDTGFFKGLKEIGDRFGPFDLTLMKIGAFDKQWPDIHLNPQESIRIHQMLRGQNFLPIHWGTFNLAFHSWYGPLETCLDIAQKEGVTVLTPQIGQMVENKNPPEFFPWWENIKK